MAKTAVIRDLEKLEHAIERAAILAIRAGETEVAVSLAEPLKKTQQKIDGHKSQRKRKRS